ncbi:hypothetical protein BH11BAC7_BH11BAC7_16430 [soil metagenome]
MLRLAAISVFILLLFGNCHKEDPDHKISYGVKETSMDSPTFSISYTSDKSGATTVGSSSSASWESGTIELKREQFISLKVDCNAPLFDFVLSVYVDGHLWDRKEMHNPTSSITISGKP